MPTSTGPPTIAIPPAELEKAGFTKAGAERYATTVTEYSQELFQRAILHADSQNEVTDRAVRTAAAVVALSFARPKQPPWLPFTMALEFVAVGALGYATNDLEKRIVVALASTIIGLLLLCLRLSKGGEK